MEKLFEVRDALVEQISKVAAEGADGATFECDVLHGKVADLEAAMRIVEEFEDAQRVSVRTDDLRGEADR